MRILFIHRAFPCQYEHIATHFARAGHEIIAIAEKQALRQIVDAPRGMRIFGYDAPPPTLNGVDQAMHRARTVAEIATQLKASGFQPDVVLAHISWGEAMFIKDVFPRAPLLLYCEYFYQAAGGDVGFDNEFLPANAATLRVVKEANAPLIVAMKGADAGVAATQWQRSCFPPWFQPKITALHDGIDTDAVAPGAYGGEELVTFATRNLEPYRGFHIFMRALPEILRRRPTAKVVVVGCDNEVTYSPRPVGGTYKQKLLRELDGKLDLSRVHFAGRLPYADYLAVLKRSAAHVYLTYPFVLSWSMLEAMAAGCVVIGSRTAPVEEVITHGKNGFLVDFFDTNQLAETVDRAIAHRQELHHIREAARRTVVERYDLKRVCLPAQVKLIESLL